MSDLRGQISSVTVRRPIDGTGKRSGALVRRSSAEMAAWHSPDVGVKWQCPECGTQSVSAEDHARHMTREFYLLRGQLNQIRDFLGAESVPFSERIASELPVTMDNCMSTVELAGMLGCSSRHARRVALGMRHSYLTGKLLVDRAEALDYVATKRSA